MLELDDGTVLCELVAICRYFEEFQPEPALFGRGALGKAQVEMWQRRVELNLFFRGGAGVPPYPPGHEGMGGAAGARMGRSEQAEGAGFPETARCRAGDREFAAGDAYSIADITGLVALDFMKPARIAIPEELTNVLRWHARDSRPAERMPPDRGRRARSIHGARSAPAASASNSRIGKPLPHEPRPVLLPSSSARILIASQAPGTKVHATGMPFTDASGDRLREAGSA